MHRASASILRLLALASDERDEAFARLARFQRGDPEQAMLDCQGVLGGGVVSYCLEHVGDLTHRMSEHSGVEQFNFGYEYVLPKVKRCLKELESAYGIEREHRENLRGTAEYRGVVPAEHADRVKFYMKRYADAHRRLRVYNEAQRCARDAAVMLGEQDFPGCVRNLKQLLVMLRTPETWRDAAGRFDE